MPILVDSSSRVLLQGIGSEMDVYQMQQFIAYGTKIAGAIYPLRQGRELLERPLFKTVKEAKKRTGCTVTIIFHPSHQVKDVLIESIYAKIPLIVCLCDAVPLHDMVEVFQVLRQFPEVRLIGPCSGGIISPGQCRAGFMPGYIYKEGCVGILSSSSTLLYEAVLQTTKNDLGQSTCLVQGVYPLISTSTVELLEMFYKDVATEAIMLLGEVDPTQEKEICEWVKRKTLKPFIALTTGLGEESLNIRLSLAKAGALVAENISRLGTLTYQSLHQV